jgi:hypothetical protein
VGTGADMEPVTTLALETFLNKLGDRIAKPATLYLLGGSALCLLGSPRETLDVDYALETGTKEIEKAINALAAELKMDLEAVPLAEFIPLPPDPKSRRLLFGRYGQLDVYIFDLYSIALSKIARGFESDLEDVQFLLDQNLIALRELEGYFQTVLPDAPRTDIDPQEFQAYFDELKKRLQ